MFGLANVCRLLIVKGAPDVLIGRCSKFVGIDGERMPLDENTRLAIERTKDSWSSQGKRVILLARKVLFKDNIFSLPTSRNFESEVMDHARSGLTLVGLVCCRLLSSNARHMMTNQRKALKTIYQQWIVSMKYGLKASIYLQ